MKRTALPVFLCLIVAATAGAAVLCVKPQRNGSFNGTVKIRDACKRGERQLSPAEVGFCCTPPTTTTTTTTPSCTTDSDCGSSGSGHACIAGMCGCNINSDCFPDTFCFNHTCQCCGGGATTTTTTSTPCATFTTTTLGVPNCGGNGPSCFGLCPNAHQCVTNPSTNLCECSGAPLPCGVVTADGMCGGTCPAGQACQLYTPTLPNGCPDYPRCACILAQ